MTSQVIAHTGCRDGSCPTIYRTDGGIVVQGYTDPDVVLPDDVKIPEGEAVVVIPADVFESLVEQYLAARVPA